MKLLRVRYVLLWLILLGLAIRLYPPVSNEFLVNFDSIYHARIGQIVADTGWIPTRDIAGGRPHLYPPLYHLLLGYGSILSGVPVIELIKYTLPLVSALLVLPVFFLIRSQRGQKAAILGALVAALNPIIISQSYDSPQIFGVLFFPPIAYFFLKGRYLAGGLLLATTLLFNYSITATIAAVLLVFGLLKLVKGSRRPLVYAILITVIGIGLASPWLLLSLSKAGECFDPSTAVSRITNAGMDYLLIIAPFVALLGIGLSYWLRKRVDDYSLLWKVSLALGTMGFLASLFIPQLHPYDQLLLVGFSLVFIIPELHLKRKYLVSVITVLAISSILAVIPVKPALSAGDLASVYWVRDNVKNATILANPEVSSAINLVAMKNSIRTEFDLFLECVPDSAKWAETYRALTTHDINEAIRIIDEYGVDYVIVGARDEWNYGFDIGKFGVFEKVFSSMDSNVYRMTSSPG